MKKIDYSKYYRSNDYSKYDKTFINIFSKRYELISRFISKPGKVLDIGCATGAFLSIFKMNGWDVLGIDPSGDKNVHREIDIIKGYFEEYDFKKNKFDLIVLNHTLEHLKDPDMVIRKAASLLRKGGFIYIDVPNYGSLSSKILGKRWPYLLPNEHLWQFTKEDLLKLISKANLKYIYWGSRSGIFEYSNYLREYYRKRFIIDLLLFPYYLLATLLNMGDSMSIIAKKI